jgi:hypothetical protein
VYASMWATDTIRFCLYLEKNILEIQVYSIRKKID